MIKINERFEIERDKYQWLLHEWSDGFTRKTKEPIRVKNTTYYATLDQIARQIVEREAGQAGNMGELRDILLMAEEIVLSAIKEKVDE